MRVKLTLEEANAALAEKQSELEKMEKDTLAEPEKIAALKNEIAELQIEVEDLQAESEAKSAKTAKYEVDKDLAKKEGKAIAKYDEYFKAAVVKFPGEACRIVSFAENKEAGKFIVVLHAEKKGLRKVELPIAGK